MIQDVSQMRELQQEVWRLQAVVKAQVEALNHWCKTFDATQMETRVRDWVTTRIGAERMYHKERAMRLLEEAVELAQAEGIVAEQINKQVQYVMARPAAWPEQEAGGVAVCLIGWCASTGNKLTEIAQRELERIEAKPIEQIRGSLARKADADLVIVKAGGVGIESI